MTRYLVFLRLLFQIDAHFRFGLLLLGLDLPLRHLVLPADLLVGSRRSPDGYLLSLEFACTKSSSLQPLVSMKSVQKLRVIVSPAALDDLLVALFGLRPRSRPVFLYV